MGKKEKCSGKHDSRDGTLEIAANNRHPTRREREREKRDIKHNLIYLEFNFETDINCFCTVYLSVPEYEFPEFLP